ncbi:Mur ligase family protein [Aliarcobacter lanthieri]|uniref:Mur ligase family protein n=1 Tax=Aliarcobacter lanthieri TaxID=1355374 RepID=UPI0004B5CAC2|nr:Mur ligase family protein [Aliarcobacter lanthieri]
MNIKSLNLEEFLKYKTMYYDKIDFSFVIKAWKILETKIKLPFVIHIVGTNGKGSTGRFLSHYLHKQNYKTLHYSSPHILKFNERIWINGYDVSDEELEYAHKFLQNLYEIKLLEKLTYFEYTTLLALYLSNNFDYLVLEAGLGGEFDATNVVKNNLSLITTIGLDHISFLGDSIEKIATTKMRSVDQKMIIGYQVFDEVYETALNVKKQILKERNTDIKISKVLDFEKYSLNPKFATYLKRNLHLVIACLEELKIPLDLKLFDDTPLFGRCQRIEKNIIIDVGHNPLAAMVLVEEFKDKKVNLIYNSYADKDYKEVLTILKPIIKTLFIIDLDDKRIIQKDKLLKVLDELKIKQNSNCNLKDDEEYLVFGSFLVVENFLKNFYDEKS